jgi:2,4-dienoyl-CoA reductase-like NADH-dependent reductase (Old Yellow Enzyme family)
VPPAAGGWLPVAPSAIPFRDGDPPPEALDEAAILAVIAAFGAAARRAREAGFRVVEIHAAHGYLLHEFLSPLSNRREDRWGGNFDNRTRLVLDVIDSVRREWPVSLPLFLRISATVWADGGWDVDLAVELARRAAARGVDVVDCSSGGLVPWARMEVRPAYQVPFAARIRRETGVRTAAVGLITNSTQADDVVRSGAADLVLLGRQLLREPQWPLRAARELGAEVRWPPQYLRAK